MFRNRCRRAESDRVGSALQHRQVRRPSAAVGSRLRPRLGQFRHHQHHDSRHRYTGRSAGRRHGLARLLRQSTQLDVILV